MLRLQSLGKWVGVAIPTLLVVCLLALFAFNTPAAKAEETSRIISVNGEAQIFVKPDVATAAFGVETNASTAKEAQKLNSAAMNQVVSSLKENGIEDKDIQTSNFSLYPVYEYRDNKSILTGYRCNNTVSIRTKDIENIGTLIDIVITAGATNVNGISFGVRDSAKYEDQMLAKAVENARHKADIMARAAGVNITGVLKISDGYVSVYAENQMIRKAFDTAAGSVPVEPGEVAISGTVRVEFGF